MNLNSNEPRESLAPGVRESNAVVATPTVAQALRRREAAARCEPFDCGHRDPLDCTAAGCGEPTEADDIHFASPTTEPPDFAQLWADAKTSFLAKDFPQYGSREWQALHPDDPKRLASVLRDAECWRLQKIRQAEEEWLLDNDPDEWWRRCMADARAAAASTVRRLNIARERNPTRAELDAAAKPKPPHQLRATPGWPPIRIPGGNGRYLTYRAQKAA